MAKILNLAKRNQEISPLNIYRLYSKTCLKQPLKNRQNKDFNDKWKLNEGRKYCRMLPLKHSAILLTCIKQ